MWRDFWKSTIDFQAKKIGIRKANLTLISLWIIFKEWQYLIASIMGLIVSAASFSL